MQNKEIFDLQRRHVEQSKGMDIREYAAHVLRLHEMEASKSLSASLHKKTAVSGDVLQNDTCVVNPNSRSGTRGFTTPVLYDGNGNPGQSNGGVSDKEETMRLKSCLEAMYCGEASSASRVLAKVGIEGAESDQKSKPKKPELSSKVPKKNYLGIGKKQKVGISKKGKQDKTPGVLKQKEFICPHHACGKAFDRRYNLKVHSRKHNGQMPYNCPKAEEGCFFSFKWRSSLRHHLRAVHNDVVPIAQNNARGTPAVIPIAQIASPVSNDIPIDSSSTSPPGSSSGAAVHSKLRVSKNGRIKKTTRRPKGKVRKNFPAVAVRQPTAEELARARRYAELKAAADRQILEKEAWEVAVPMTGQRNSVRPSMAVDSQPSLANKSSATDGILEVSAFPSLHETELPVANGSQGASGTENFDVDIDDILKAPSFLALDGRTILTAANGSQGASGTENFEVDIDEILNVSAFPASDEAELPVENGSQAALGTENVDVDIDEIFGDIGDDVSSGLELPVLGDLQDV